MAVLVLIVCALGLRTDWFPYQAGAPHSAHPLPGETWGGIQTGEFYYHRDGLKFWLLERIGDKTYTHNVNIGGFIQYAALLLGARSHVPFALANALAFLAGLWLGYLTVLRACKDHRIALAFLFFFGTNYYFNLLFAFNMRAWHWLGMFSVLYCTLLLCDGDKRGRLWIFPAALVAFVCSYDFAAEVACAAIAVAAMRRHWQSVAYIVSGFAAAFALRQLQVIGGIGLEAWATDIYYSATIKSGFLTRWLGAPNMVAVEAWYDAHGIQRYASSPTAMSVSEYLRIVREAFQTDWMPFLGLSAVGLLGYVCIRSPAWRFLMAVTLGIAVGLAVFAPYSLVFAFNHRVPLLLFPIALATAILFVQLWQVRAAAVLAGLLLAFHVYAQYENWRDFHLATEPFPLLRVLFH